MAMEATRGDHAVDAAVFFGDFFRWAIPRLLGYVAAAVVSVALFVGWASFYTYIWPGKLTLPADVSVPVPIEPLLPMLPSEESDRGALVAEVQKQREQLQVRLAALEAELNIERARIQAMTSLRVVETMQAIAQLTELQKETVWQAFAAAEHAMAIKAEPSRTETLGPSIYEVLGAPIYDAQNTRVGEVRAIIVTKGKGKIVIINMDISESKKSIAYPAELIEWKVDPGLGPHRGIARASIVQLQKLPAVPEEAVLGTLTPVARPEQ